ncbi:aminoglycoside phosphotransferase family protein [Gryllotalpicola koreensis]|uniref:Aminoglycoside phosphotransferase domain-containing protein n=1 Tax=Gryllotalpicola koreensis TaxID=993086 RepID=A0ABP8A8S1_9MICO
MVAYLGDVHVLSLEDGRALELGERTKGGTKNETRYGTIGTDPVVVKIQRAHGRLRDEEAALAFLTAAGVRVPRVVAAGTTPTGEPFLVITRESGTRTNTPEGWWRFGRDLACLLDVSTDTCPFPRITATEFTADHRERLDLVRPLLAPSLAAEIDEAIAVISGTDHLVVTHGDPGSGNYLDSGNDDEPGVLLDWETASVSPQGIDLGRAVFIGLMDLGRSGIPDQLTAALVRGYTARAAVAARLDSAHLRAWTTIAGLQFIHGRFTQPLVPERTPKVAARVLETYLANAR